ncbi:hypothetical protein HRbin14_02197 [bacterium HR14]|nr:hypothetical protein HRbin14_02197 [bacterium HR14]
MIRAVLTLVVAVVGALGLTEVPSDVVVWYHSPAALAVVVAAFVALVRKHVVKVERTAAVLLSLGVGVALAALGHYAGLLVGGWLEFGLLAGLLASGGVDLIRSITGGGNAGTSPGPSPDPERARLR